jgi:hypothetical protein
MGRIERFFVRMNASLLQLTGVGVWHRGGAGASKGSLKKLSAERVPRIAASGGGAPHRDGGRW